MLALELLGNMVKMEMYVEAPMKGFSQVAPGTSDQGRKSRPALSNTNIMGTTSMILNFLVANIKRNK